MQFCKVITYKLKYSQLIYIAVSLSRNSLTVPSGLSTFIKIPETGVCWKHVTPVINGND